MHPLFLVKVYIEIKVSSAELRHWPDKDPVFSSPPTLRDSSRKHRHLYVKFSCTLIIRHVCENRLRVRGLLLAPVLAHAVIRLRRALCDHTAVCGGSGIIRRDKAGAHLRAQGAMHLLHEAGPCPPWQGMVLCGFGLRHASLGSLIFGLLQEPRPACTL